MAHEQVKHPNELLAEARSCRSWLARVSDDLSSWIADHVLGSAVMFWIAFVVPIALAQADTNTKLLLALISGSWIQWWALHALYRGQKKSEARDGAKADVDHKTLTYLAQIQDEQLDILKRLDPKETT